MESNPAGEDHTPESQAADGEATGLGGRHEENAYDLLQRGQALLERKHYAQAAIVLERADRLEPRRGSILEALGRAYFNSGQAERGRVTADLVHEIRARLDNEGYQHVKIVVSGGLNPERIQYFKDAGAPVDSYAVGSYISGAAPIDFTGDIKEIDGAPIAKRGRIPGLTDSPRLRPVDLATYREG